MGRVSTGINIVARTGVNNLFENEFTGLRLESHKRTRNILSITGYPTNAIRHDYRVLGDLEPYCF